MKRCHFYLHTKEVTQNANGTQILKALINEDLVFFILHSRNSLMQTSNHHHYQSKILNIIGLYYPPIEK